MPNSGARSANCWFLILIAGHIERDCVGVAVFPLSNSSTEGDDVTDTVKEGLPR